MKTGELATTSTVQVGKTERRSTARVARQVWVQRAAHSKKSGAEESQKWGHVHVRTGRTKKTHLNTYVSTGHTALCNERSRRRTVARITPKKKKDRREKDKKTALPRRSKGRQIKHYFENTING